MPLGKRLGVLGSGTGWQRREWARTRLCWRSVLAVAMGSVAGCACRAGALGVSSFFLTRFQI